MTIYTLVVDATSIIVHDGAVKGSRRAYYADDFEIRTSGAIATGRRPAVNHMAMELAIAHHIPLIQLKREVK